MSTMKVNAILDAAGGNTATVNGITPALASQAEAQAGTDNTKLMTPLRVKQARTVTWGTSQASTSGSAIDFVGIPSNATEIFISFEGVSLNGTDNFLIQLGTSGGFATTGYVAAAIYSSSGGALGYSSSAGFVFGGQQTAGLYNGVVVLYLQDVANRWGVTGGFGTTVNSVGSVGVGSVTLGGTLTQVRITRTGTNTFDAGSINVGYCQ